MIDNNRDNKYGAEYEYYLNNDSCGVIEFYNSLNNDIEVSFKSVDNVTFEQYENSILENIDSAYEVVLNDNIYDRLYSWYDDNYYWDDRLDCGCCACCGCSCHDDDFYIDNEE